jgi:hypothetical protein
MSSADVSTARTLVGKRALKLAEADFFCYVLRRRPCSSRVPTTRRMDAMSDKLKKSCAATAGADHYDDLTFDFWGAKPELFAGRRCSDVGMAVFERE